MTRTLSLSLIIFFLLLTGCFNNYDPALKTPDGNGGGYYLTPLGCLLNTPFAYDMTDIGYNVKIVRKDKEISSTAHPHSELQKDLVFELQRNGTVNYWFKKDYLEPADKIVTGPDGQSVISHTILPSDRLSLKHLYTNGAWTVNFKDSTLKIDFGK